AERTASAPKIVAIAALRASGVSWLKDVFIRPPGGMASAAAHGIDAAGLVAWARELAERTSAACGGRPPVVDAAAEAPRLRLGPA
ncbi:hypothetical protein ACWCPG_34545, partial [Streptomyces sp. NPDC001919]